MIVAETLLTFAESMGLAKQPFTTGVKNITGWTPHT